MDKAWTVWTVVPVPDNCEKKKGEMQCISPLIFYIKRNQVNDKLVTCCSAMGLDLNFLCKTGVVLAQNIKNFFTSKVIRKIGAF